jgi:serine/threonine protein phosphatase PrpC
LQAAAALTKVQAEAQERAPGWDAQAAPWQIPSATFMLARDRAGEIELAWVGDCVAIWRDASGRCLRVGGERFLAEPGAGSPANLRGEARLRKLRQDRALVIGNAKFSFTLSGDGRACRSRSIPAAAGGHLLLMSDGFYRLADPLALMNDVELIDAAVEGGLRKLTSLLRQEERRYRKVLARKRHDDATALLLHLRP